MSTEPEGRGYSPRELDQKKVAALLQAAPADFYQEVYLDLQPNQPKNDETRASFRELLQAKFDLQVAGMMERYWSLPPLILRRPSAEYISLLEEARELFRTGYFYSCVAMCGIVGEKLVKDLLRESTLIELEGKVMRPTSEAFDQLERIDSSSIVRFVNKAGLLSDEARKAADKLIQLRNSYAHARGSNPEKDAFDAIKDLHDIVEGTVSVLKDYQIVDGKFVARSQRR